MSDRPVMMIVDDSQISSYLLAKACEEEYDILFASGGREALEMLARHHVDIILLDIVMPEMDGYDVLRALHADEALRRIPVIVVSVNERGDAEERALALGADVYIPKPVPPGIIKKRIANLLGKYVDERKRLEEELAHTRTHDPLTGLPNAEAFYTAVTQLLSGQDDTPFTLVLWDIRRFKVVNDLFGRRTGDGLLIAIGGMLSALLLDDAPICRLSGDMFAACLPTERVTPAWLQQFVSKTFSVGEMRINVRFGIGLYNIDDRALSPLLMCDRARMAAKSISSDFVRNYAAYREDLLHELHMEQLLLDDLDAALQTGQFVVYYQPCYNPQTQEIIAAEALVRWLHPERGFILPMNFIPQLENNGLISKVDREVWRQVCQGIAKRRDMGLPHVPISLNISRFDIYSPSIQEELLALCAQYEIEPSDLALEITERAYIHMLDEGNRTLTELQKVGFILEMDDFGVGNSSLGVLKSMPVDAIKLDMRFLTGYDPYKRGQGIIEGTVQMSKRIGVTVIAEGVEDASQLTFLRLIGCEGVQGYYFARPMTEEDFEKKLFEQRELIAQNAYSNPVRKRRMLIAGGDQEDLLRQAFGGLYNIAQANSGRDALDYLQTHSIDILLLDTGLLPPGDDSLLNAIADDPYLCDCPVILLTSASPDDRQQALAARTDDFIAQGTNFATARRRVENAVTNRLIAREKQRSELISLRLKAEYDALTGVYTRATAEQLISMEVRNIGANSALLLLDIDRFAQLRAQYGAVCTDALLKDTAEILRASLRNADIIGRLREGGFIVFLFDVKTQHIARRKATEILQKIAALPGVGINETVTASIGVDMLSKAVVTYGETYERAQRALEQAQRVGGGCMVMYRQSDT